MSIQFCRKGIFCLLIFCLLAFSVPKEMYANGQIPRSLGGPYQKTPGNTVEVVPRLRPPGSGLGTDLPPSYADPRFIIRQKPGSPITEKLDTSIADGFVYVNSAYFVMGGSQGEYNAKTPGHRVSVRSFWVSPYEVYWKLWDDVLRWGISRGYRFAHRGWARQVTPLSGLDNAVTRISWYDAIVWCNAYSEVRGLEPVYRYNSTVSSYVVRSSVDRKVLQSLYVDYNANGYRLPTEAEWELAARGGVAGQGYLFAGSNKEEDVAWFFDNTRGERYGHPVGLLRPNELGLYDMNGNVAEWTADWYSSDYYYSSPVENPLGPGTGKFRAVRGGSFRTRPKEDFFTRRGRRRRKRKTWLGVEMRERLRPKAYRLRVGFRPARTAIFRPVDYLEQPRSADDARDLGDRPALSTPGELTDKVNDASPYIYSLDPNYNPNHSPYRDDENSVRQPERRSEAEGGRPNQILR